MSRRGIDAANEDAATAVVVWCGNCGARGRPLGEVRRSSAGLVFDAMLPGDVTFPPGVRERILAGFRAGGARRLPIPVAVGRCVILLDDDDEPGETPAVECPRCGRHELARDELVAAARRQTTKAPVKLVIRDSSHTVR